MRALLPLILDTWRQSRQQAVFLIMIGLLAVTVILAVVLAQPVTSQREDVDAGADAPPDIMMFAPEGDAEPVERVKILGLDNSEFILSDAWVGIYSQSIALDYMQDGEMPDPFSEEGQDYQVELMHVAELEAKTAPKRRCVEVFVFFASRVIYMISIMLFIAACSGYFPAMLESGAIDIVLAKPLERWKIFFGKYLGGLALFAAALFSSYLLLFVGLGVRTGVWHFAVFRVMPLQLFAAATLFALIGLIGIWRGSTTLALILGYVYYIVVDSIVTVLTNPILQFGGERWQKVQKVLHYTLPSFDNVRDQSLLSIVNAPSMQWQPVLVMLAWLLLSLGAGYWLFARRDY